MIPPIPSRNPPVSQQSIFTMARPGTSKASYQQAFVSVTYTDEADSAAQNPACRTAVRRKATLATYSKDGGINSSHGERADPKLRGNTGRFRFIQRATQKKHLGALANLPTENPFVTSLLCLGAAASL